ncbi:MAG: hypothetical protein ABRQ39_21380 [Candidatus Eremiobacterota bacterium]
MEKKENNLPHTEEKPQTLPENTGKETAPLSDKPSREPSLPEVKSAEELKTDRKEQEEVKPEIKEEPRPEIKEKPFTIPVAPDKYDKQVLTLKNLGYSEQQILDNLLRLNPELHEKKHVAAQAVGKYFERKQPAPEPVAPVMMGGMELTEEMKEFIESSLRKQIDAFRNIVKDERDRRLSFIEALSVKTLEWAPLLLFIQVIFTVTFLLYKGGLDGIAVIFYGPSVPSQIIPLAFIFLVAGLLVLMVFLKDHVYDEKALDKFKVLIYLVLFPLILSIQIMALDRYRNEATWMDFRTINNRDYFLKRWYETDYRDRVVFLNRTAAFIESKYTGTSDVTLVARPLVYLDVELFDPDLPDRKVIAIYKSILLYDQSSEHRIEVIEKLRKMLAVQKTVMFNMEERLSLTKKMITDTSPVKSNERFYVVDNIIEKIRINKNHNLVAVTNILKSVVRNDKDINVRLKAIEVLKDLGIAGNVMEELISQEKDQTLFQSLYEAINK